VNTFTHLSDGTWGLKWDGTGPEPIPGRVVDISRRDGRTQKALVETVERGFIGGPGCVYRIKIGLRHVPLTAATKAPDPTPTTTTRKGEEMPKSTQLCSWKEIEAIADALGEARKHAILTGPPGRGKTTLAKRQGTYSVTLTPETPAAELRGHFIPKGGEFVWHDGPAIRAWREGTRFVIDEVDQASGDCMVFLHILLDDPAMAKMTLPTGETIKPAQGFHAIATTNAKDLTLVLSEALLDRFSVRFAVTDYHPNALKSLDDKNMVKLIEMNKITIRQAFAYQSLLKAGVAGDTVAKAIFGKFADAVALALAGKDEMAGAPAEGETAGEQAPF
jgi:AAA domain (dynein-related subfamily)